MKYYLLARSFCKDLQKLTIAIREAKFEVNGCATDLFKQNSKIITLNEFFNSYINNIRHICQAVATSQMKELFNCIPIQ